MIQSANQLLTPQKVRSLYKVKRIDTDYFNNEF